MQTLLFESEIDENEESEVQILKFRVNETDAWMDYAYYEPKNIKKFILFLAKTLETLKEKKLLFFVQSVSYDDWKNELSKNDLWKIRKEFKDDGYLVIECPLNDALKCICLGLGIE